jgi:hypothetical protein
MRTVFVLVFILGASVGCPPPATALNTTRARAAHDFSCKESDVEVTSIAGDSVEAKGCGQSRVYDCVKSTPFKYTCVPEGNDPKKSDYNE